jgi:hypothetical protein
MLGAVFKVVKSLRAVVIDSVTNGNQALKLYIVLRRDPVWESISQSVWESISQWGVGIDLPRAQKVDGCPCNRANKQRCVTSGFAWRI